MTVTEGDKNEKCGKELKGCFASNMKKHLKQKHKKAYQKFEKEEVEKSKTEASTSKGSKGIYTQAKITDIVKVPTYPKDSKKQLAITNKLAVFVGSTNVPLSLVDNPEFRDLLIELDKRYDIPGRKKLCKEIDKVYTAVI